MTEVYALKKDPPRPDLPAPIVVVHKAGSVVFYYDRHPGETPAKMSAADFHLNYAQVTPEVEVSLWREYWEGKVIPTTPDADGIVDDVLAGSGRDQE